MQQYCPSLNAECLRLSIQDPLQPGGVRVVEEFCSPLDLSAATANSQDERNFPIIIKSSLVFLDFQTVNQTKDAFSAAFSFHNGEFGVFLE